MIRLRYKLQFVLTICIMLASTCIINLLSKFCMDSCELLTLVLFANHSHRSVVEQGLYIGCISRHLYVLFIKSASLYMASLHWCCVDGACSKTAINSWQSTKKCPCCIVRANIAKSDLQSKRKNERAGALSASKNCGV